MNTERLQWLVREVDCWHAAINDQPDHLRCAIAHVLDDPTLLPAERAKETQALLEFVDLDMRKMVQEARVEHEGVVESRRRHLAEIVDGVARKPSLLGLLSMGETCAVATVLGREDLLPDSYPTWEAAAERMDDWQRELALKLRRDRLRSAQKA